MYNMADFISITDFIALLPLYVTVADIQECIGKGFDDRSDVITAITEVANARIAAQGESK